MGETRIKQICLAFPVPQRCVALALTVRDGYGFTYRNAMSVVRREIKLSDLGISEIRPRRAVTGGLIFETAGQEASSKASRLAEKMAGALRDIPAKVTVPRKTAELRVTGLEDSIIPEEVTVAVAEEGNCQTVGVIRAAPRSLDALPADSGKENRRQQRRGKRHSTRRQPPHTMVSGEGLPSPGTPTPSATSAWRRATCAGIARQRLTGRIVATGAAWKGIVQGTAWHGYLNARYARTWDCPRRTGWDLQRVSHRPAGGGPYKR
jgi:hypothetical protein